MLFPLLSGQIIRTAKSVVMKLTDRYPFLELFGQSLLDERCLVIPQRVLTFNMSTYTRVV